MYSGAGHASQGGGHSGKYDVQKEKKNSKTINLRNACLFVV